MINTKEEKKKGRVWSHDMKNPSLGSGAYKQEKLKREKKK
jgi:hypothetical protein